MSSLLGEHKQGLLFIVSAPAGTGKTTLMKKLVEEFPSIVMSLSFTTRTPRPDEIQGKDYCFISRSEFEKKITDSDFLEYVKLYDDYYGTSRQWVTDQLKSGKHVVLVIDTQGAKSLRSKVSATIFIVPPSLEELKKRLTLRATEKPEVLEKRIKKAASEIAEAIHYDYQIINDDLNTAYEVLKSIFIAECHRNLKK